MVNLMIFAPRSSPTPFPAGIKCQTRSWIRCWDVPGDVPGVPSPRTVPRGAWLSYGNAAGGEGVPGDGALLRAWAAPLWLFWGGESKHFGVKSENFGVKSERFWEFTPPALLPVPGGAAGSTTPILALSAPGSPPCSWHPPPPQQPPNPPPAIPGTQNTNVP